MTKFDPDAFGKRIGQVVEAAVAEATHEGVADDNLLMVNFGDHSTLQISP